MYRCFFIPSVKFWLEFYAVMCEYSYFLLSSLVSLSVFSYALTFNLSFSVRWICLDKEGLNLTLTSLISLCLNCDVNTLYCGLLCYWKFSTDFSLHCGICCHTGLPLLKSSRQTSCLWSTQEVVSVLFCVRLIYTSSAIMT